MYGIENPIYTVLDTRQDSKAVIPQPVNWLLHFNVPGNKSSQ